MMKEMRLMMKNQEKMFPMKNKKTIVPHRHHKKEFLENGPAFYGSFVLILSKYQ